MTRVVAHEALVAAGVAASALRGGRHHEPARDRRGLGRAHRRSRCTTRSCGRTAAPPRAATSCARRGSRTLVRRAHGPRDRPLLLRHEDRVAAARTSTGLRDARRGGRRALRHDRRVARLQAHRAARSPTTRTRRARCCSTSHALRWRRRAVRGARRAGRGAARGRSRPRSVLGETDPDAFLGARVPLAGHGGRPAGRALRPGVPRAGPRQEHLRDRQLRAAERRAAAAAGARRAC